MIWGFTLDPYGTVKKHIENWKPRNCRTEKEFEKSLARKLDKELKNQKIETEYGYGKQRIDIVVDGKVPIEIKYNLKITSAFQKLIGQLELYLEIWDIIIVVLCGEIKSVYLNDIRKYAEGKTGVPIDEPVQIVVKGKII